MVRESMLERYAELLIEYSLSVQEGEKVLIETTPLAEDLVLLLMREIWQRGGTVEVIYRPHGLQEIFYRYASQTALKSPSPFKTLAFETFDGYLHIRAPYNLRGASGLPKEKLIIRREALQQSMQIYRERTGDLSLKRSLCQYPTLASAQMAGMSLSEYEEFVFNACKLYDDHPTRSWQALGKKQQKIVDFLNSKTLIRYSSEKTDIRFSTEGRTWINSDGKTNMPSGEVYTAPVDDSAEGVIYFDYPSVYRGNEVSGVTLEFRAGKVVRAHAEKGQEYLDKIMDIPGANRLGEAAIGTNMNIKRATKNILFDEKIGGSVHLALGQAYLQCGGQNHSAIHWDMISDMMEGKIYADGDLIYENGKFLEF